MVKGMKKRLNYLRGKLRLLVNTHKQRIILRFHHNNISAKPYSGLTLIELMVVVIILALLMSMAIPSYNRALKKSKVTKAIADIKFLEKEIMIFKMEHGRLPNSLAELGLGNMKDPWGNPYCYLNFANTTGKGTMRKDRFLVPINSDYDLYSMGADGKTATPLTAEVSQDDIVRANDGGFVGLGKDY